MHDERRTRLKYKRIEQDIRQQIQRGVLRPGDKLKSEEEYIREYAVSSITIRKAMGALAEAGLVRRVRGKGTLVNDKGASATSKRIAVIMPYLEQPDVSHLTILRGIQRYFADRDYSMIMEWFNECDDAVSDVVNKVLQQDVEGLLIYPQDPQSIRPIFTHLTERRLPFVCLDRYDVFAKLNFVGSDNYAGGALVARHLTELGHRKMLYLSHMFALSSERERYDGFCSELYRCGIPFGPERVMMRADVQALAADIGRGEVTAVFCANDRLASGLIKQLSEAGIAIPRDVSIVGFDQWAMLAQSGLRLTTIRQDFESVGALAAKLLYELINDPELTTPIRVLTSVELIEGDTTAPPCMNSKSG